MGGQADLIANQQRFMIAQKPVKEIVVNSHGVPEKHLSSSKEPGSEDGNNYGGSLPLMDAPFIDMGLLMSDSSSQSARAQELSKLREVLSSWGCFQLVNHGMTSSFLDQVREVMKQFFTLPGEEKQRYKRKADGFEGYEIDDVFKTNIKNWLHRFHLITHPKDRSDPQFWPQNPQAFREVMEKFGEKSQLIAQELLKAMAVSLNLDEKCFLNHYGEEKGVMFARFNYYPPCPTPDKVLGFQPHTDATGITILLQDSEVEALQVQKDGHQWFRVPIIPHALFVNIGDQMEIMSNGVFKSAFHRVTTNAEKERVSLAMLSSPDPENEIGPVAPLINEKQPKKFLNVKDYGQLVFTNGMNVLKPIDLLRIN